MKRECVIPKDLFGVFVTFSNTIERHCHLTQTPNWFVAVSGGRDSLLVWFLAELWVKRFAPQTQIRILHVQYPFRHGASRERLALERLAQTCGRPIWVRETSEKELSQTNIQAQARTVRIRFFKEAVEKTGGCILTGKHGDDSVENVLLRCARQATWWTWTDGIDSQNLPVVAPLETVSRQDILKAFGCVPWPFFEDHSNTSMRFRRNCVRHFVLPYANLALGGQASEARTLLPLQRQADGYVLEKVAEAVNQVSGSENPNQHWLDYGLLRKRVPELFDLCVWVWLAKRSPRVNAKQFVQLLCGLSPTEKQFPKTFVLSDGDSVVVRKDMLRFVAMERKDLCEMPKGSS